MAQQPQQPAHEQQPDTAKTPETTQEQLAHDSGDGIRGGYGNSDQTNGLEGGSASASDNQQPADKSEKQE
ncbi:hypothetical protein [Hymenobacter pini]|uniref:hypothetical protein n=1 Tax=Hymenobacter pini TaxID=2880879 RepID=UPI001CF3A930|nr:hypothetical protein [Hymenobacter pini]MCA8829194.1 hypothetical protein [Hymenobacter pini]